MNRFCKIAQDLTVLSIAATNPVSAGVSAPRGTFAIDSTGRLWLKVGTSNTDWKCLGYDVTTFSAVASVDFTCPATFHVARLVIVATATVDNSSITPRINGSAATSYYSVTGNSGGVASNNILGATGATAGFTIFSDVAQNGSQTIWHGKCGSYKDTGGTAQNDTFTAYKAAAATSVGMSPASGTISGVGYWTEVL